MDLQSELSKTIAAFRPDLSFKEVFAMTIKLMNKMSKTDATFIHQGIEKYRSQLQSGFLIDPFRKLLILDSYRYRSQRSWISRINDFSILSEVIMGEKQSAVYEIDSILSQPNVRKDVKELLESCLQGNEDVVDLLQFRIIHQSRDQ